MRSLEHNFYRSYMRSEAKKLLRRLAGLKKQDLPPLIQRAALNAFRRAAVRVPAYGEMLRSHRVDPRGVRTLDDFVAMLPLLDKQSVFGTHELTSLCVGGSLDGAAVAYTSSGFSGTFSWGVDTHGDERRLRKQIDLLLELNFQAASRRTLLINALPSGVRVPATLPIVVDTSTRIDAALAAVSKLGPACEQIVLVGEQPLLKAMIEAGVAQGMNWRSRPVFVVTGGETMAESYRGYIGQMLGHDPGDASRGYVLLSLGISEIGLSLGQETPEVRAIRAAAADDPRVRRAVFGETPFLPTLVQYNPMRYFIETVEQDGRPRLVVSTLDPTRSLPLMRYCTGDWARVIAADAVAEAVRKIDRPELAPRGVMPFLAVWGRGRSLTAGGHELFPEQVKEALYAQPELAQASTANFRLESINGRAQVRVQCKPETDPSAMPVEAFKADLAGRTGMAVAVELCRYADFPGMELNYQRKFAYLG